MFCYDKQQQYEAGLKKPDTRFPFYFNRQSIELRSWSQPSTLETTGEFRFINGESLKSEPILWKHSPKNLPHLSRLESICPDCL